MLRDDRESGVRGSQLDDGGVDPSESQGCESVDVAPCMPDWTTPKSSRVD